MKSIEGNFDNSEVDELLKKHFIELRSVSPVGSTHVLDINGLKDSLIENVNGLKYRLNDKNNFISIILDLLNDSNLRINLGERGREFILQKFKEDKVLSDLSDMIESNL